MLTLKTIDISQILQPGGLIAWIIVGLIAGSLATAVIRGRGYGCLGNIIVGLIGSVIGAVLASALDLGSFKFIGSIIVSFVGACILVAVLQLFRGERG